MGEIATLPMTSDGALPLPRVRRGAPPAASSSHGSAAASIAESASAALAEAASVVGPYSSHGAVLRAEAEVEHRSADGSVTRAHFKFSYGRERCTAALQRR